MSSSPPSSSMSSEQQQQILENGYVMEETPPFFELLTPIRHYDLNGRLIESIYSSSSAASIPLPAAQPAEGEVSISAVRNIETSVGMKSNVDLLIAFEGKNRLENQCAKLTKDKDALNERLRSQLRALADHGEEFSKLDERLDTVDNL